MHELIPARIACRRGIPDQIVQTAPVSGRHPRRPIPPPAGQPQPGRRGKRGPDDAGSNEHLTREVVEAVESNVEAGPDWRRNTAGSLPMTRSRSARPARRPSTVVVTSAVSCGWPSARRSTAVVSPLRFQSAGKNAFRYVRPRARRGPPARCRDTAPAPRDRQAFEEWPRSVGSRRQVASNRAATGAPSPVRSQTPGTRRTPPAPATGRPR